MKKIWITSLPKDEKQVGLLLSTSKNYALDANGHFWIDELKKMAWQASLQNIIDKDTGLWVIIGSKKDIEPQSVRYGLSLLALSAQAARETGINILWLCPGDMIMEEDLPTPFRNADIFSVSDSSIGAKLVARANMPSKKPGTEYRLNIHANPGYGVWIETGPCGTDNWNGAMVGVCNGKIDAHGVGEAGRLPLKSVLEYPVQGLKLKLSDKEYAAWAAQNVLASKNSYFARLCDVPESILFGEYAKGEEAEVHVICF